MTGLDCLREEMEKRGLKEVRLHEQQLRYLKKAVDEWNKEAEKAREHRKHFEAYIDEFNKSLQECETAEGRDAMRTAQIECAIMHIQTAVDVDPWAVEIAVEAMERMASANLQPNLRPTCNLASNDCISRRDAIDAIQGRKRG